MKEERVLGGTIVQGSVGELKHFYTLVTDGAPEAQVIMLVDIAQR